MKKLIKILSQSRAGGSFSMSRNSFRVSRRGMSAHKGSGGVFGGQKGGPNGVRGGKGWGGGQTGREGGPIRPWRVECYSRRRADTEDTHWKLLHRQIAGKVEEAGKG